MAQDAYIVDFRAVLAAERRALLAQLAELGHGDGSELHYDSNFADSSQVTAERGETEALTVVLREQVEVVDRALAKWDDGTFGICEVCSRPISETRLEAMPTATRCIDCASRS